jgi:hypothetical protein
MVDPRDLPLQEEVPEWLPFRINNQDPNKFRFRKIGDNRQLR